MKGVSIFVGPGHSAILSWEILDLDHMYLTMKQTYPQSHPHKFLTIDFCHVLFVCFEMKVCNILWGNKGE